MASSRPPRPPTTPMCSSYALFAYGYAFRDADPVGALEALRRGLVIAQDSGNRCSSPIWRPLCLDLRPNTATRWRRSITSLWPSATTTILATSALSVSPWQLSRYSSTGSDASNRRPPSPDSRIDPIHRAALPEITTAIAHLRDVLGEATYESLARKGETMTTAAMATYAYDQIDQARTELEHPG